MRKYLLCLMMVVLFLAFASQALAAYPSPQYLTGWGNDDKGQTSEGPDRVPPPMANPLEKVYTDWAGGGWSSIALRSDGTLEGWGDDNPSIASFAPPAGNDFVKVEGLLVSQAALRSNGVIELWGIDDFGQSSGTIWPGDPPCTPSSDYPVYASMTDPEGGYTDMGGMIYTLLALDGAGQIKGWGQDKFATISGAPAGTDFVQVDATNGTGLALKDDGTIVAWAKNWDGIVTNAPIVNAIVGAAGGTIVDIAGGSGHAMVLTDYGDVIAWGWNHKAQCGGLPGNPQPAPPTVIATDAAGISAGAWSSCVLYADGHVENIGGDRMGMEPGGRVFNYLGDGGNWHYAALADVPEPATIMLLGLGGLALIRRRRA